MTVKQLIDKLQNFPQDWPVVVKIWSNGHELYEPSPKKDAFQEANDMDDSGELYDGQQVVSL
jgi:hypothetical protein